MRLALYTDYGLRILIYLAGHQERATIAQIAEFFAISKDHLAKVAQRLTRHGLIRSVRGMGGGLELARHPEDISIGEVILVMEGKTHLLECVGADKKPVCVIQPGCQLRAVFAHAERMQMDYLNSVKLSDVSKPGVRLVSITI